jgi:hypothetical protein
VQPVIKACNDLGLSVQMRFTPRKSDSDPHGKITISHGETTVYENPDFARNPYSRLLNDRLAEIIGALKKFIQTLDAKPAEEEEVAAN